MSGSTTARRIAEPVAIGCGFKGPTISTSHSGRSRGCRPSKCCTKWGTTTTRGISLSSAKKARRDAEKNPWRKTWLGMLHFTVGGGYKPWWALYWSFAFFLIGWFTFWSANSLGYMTPRDGGVIAYLAANPGKPVPARYTEFNSFLYAADAFLPVIELGQDLAWEPTTVRDPRSSPLPTDSSPHAKNIRGLAEAYAHGAHRVVYWTEEVLGWIFVSLFIAGMSGIMKKE